MWKWLWLNNQPQDIEVACMADKPKIYTSNEMKEKKWVLDIENIFYLFKENLITKSKLENVLLENEILQKSVNIKVKDEFCDDLNTEQWKIYNWTFLSRKKLAVVIETGRLDFVLWMNIYCSEVYLEQMKEMKISICV